MGRYGRYNRPDERRYNVNEDWDSNKPQKPESVEQDWDSSEENKPNVISRVGSNIKERYQRYNSDEARNERRQRELVKRSKKIADLSYTAKKEGLKAQIRKSKQTAPTDFGFGMSVPSKKSSKRSSSREGGIYFPKTSYGNMDRMLGLGGPVGNTRLPKKKPTSNWGSFDRMFGV